jgi:hypothetical protein
MNLHVVGPCLTFQMGRKFQGSKWHDSSETGRQTGIIHFITPLNCEIVPCSKISTQFSNIHIYIYERSAKPQLKNAIFGSKLSFLGVHYIVLQYVLIAAFASPGKLRAESLFTPPLQRLKHV